MSNSFQYNEIEKEVIIMAHKNQLKGIIALPEKARAIIIFAHGSGSSRFSPRNNYVARRLQSKNFATLLVDLLNEEEESNRENVFNLTLLAKRLLAIRNWLTQRNQTKQLKIGYFGASTGAGAALIAAAQNPSHIYAIVSRGGRPDLAETFLPQVTVPTLLIVGGHDEYTINLNKKTFNQLHCDKDLKIIPGATHLFEEPGALEMVERYASQWFLKYLTAGPSIALNI